MASGPPAVRSCFSGKGGILSQRARGKPGRNDPCDCGSGRKFKKCHMDREDQAPTPYHELANQLKQARQGDRTCLYPVTGGICTNPVIRAHSVARSSALSKLAINDRVYQVDVDPFSIERTRGELTHKLVSIRSATTFTGFCSQHDNQLFAPIDIELSTLSAEQVLLLHYRALCREFYVSRPTLESNQVLRSLDRGREQAVQAFVQGYVNARDKSVSKSLQELQAEKDTCDGYLANHNFSNIRALILEFNSTPMIACSGLNRPFFDFTGKVLQNYADMSKDMEMLSFTLIPAAGGGLGVLAWLKKSDWVCRPFAESLDSLSNVTKSSAIVQWVFDSFENYALNPTWWDSLTSDDKSEIQKFLRHGADITKMPNRNSLVPVRRVFANWHFSSSHWL
jgi:hypothetical protein